MRYNIILRYVGFVMLLNAALMLLSAAVGYIKGFDSGFYPLALSAPVSYTHLHGLGFELGVTPRNGHYRIGIQAMQLANQIAALLVGMLGNRTAVYHVNIRRSRLGYPLETRLGKTAGERRALREIDFATQCNECYPSVHGLSIVFSDR